MFKILKLMFNDLFKIKPQESNNDNCICECIDISDNLKDDKNKMTDEEFYQFLKENNISKEEYNSW